MDNPIIFILVLTIPSLLVAYAAYIVTGRQTAKDVASIVIAMVLTWIILSILFASV